MAASMRSFRLGALVVARSSSPRVFVSTTVVRSFPDGGRINTTVAPSTGDPIVTEVNAKELAAKAAFCRCWLSAQFPKCDGTHLKHNKATGDNVGPVVVLAQGQC